MPGKRNRRKGGKKTKHKVRKQVAKPNKCTNQTRKIEGVHELTILEHGDGSKFVFLGDAHSDNLICAKDEKCPSKSIPIDKYVKNLLNDYWSDIPLDIFVESQFKNPESAPMANVSSMFGQGYLGYFVQNFYACFLREKKYCPYKFPPFRFHYADIRSGVFQSTMTPTEQMETKANAIFFANVIVPTFYGVKIPIQEFARGAMLSKKIVEQKTKYFLHMFKIDKQVAKIKNRIIKQLFNTYVDTFFREQGPRFENFVSGITEINVSDFSLAYFNFVAWFFDMYVIGRILRHEMKRVILFAGTAHTHNIRHFFVNFLGFKQTWSDRSGVLAFEKKEDGTLQFTVKPDIDGDAQCIHLEEVEEPWFP